MGRRRQGAGSVRRTIYFYELQDRHTEQCIQGYQILRLVSLLVGVIGNASQAYMSIEDSDVVRVWIDESQAFPLRLKFGVTRRTSLPPTERAGVLADLNLPPDQGLSELIHCVFYENAIVGIEFNFYGPRPSKLAAYIQEKTSMLVKFVPLVSRRAAEQLARYNSLSLFQLKVKSVVLDEVRQASETVAGLLENIADYNGVETIEIRVGTRARTDDVLDGRILRGIRSFVRNFTEWGSVKKMTVKGTDGETGRDVEIDLLSEHLMSQQQVVRIGERSRAVQSESAYGAIDAAARELHREIMAAIGRQN